MAKTADKVTKAQVLEALVAYFEDPENAVSIELGDVTVNTEDIVEYANTTIEQLAAKATKAKERAAEKKAEGDALKKAVAEVLTDEYQTLDAIFEQIEGEDITKAKITARLTQLVKTGEAHKTDLKIDGKVRKGYAAGPAPVEEDEDEE